jgi:hypothetical protein
LNVNAKWWPLAGVHHDEPRWGVQASMSAGGLAH